jgi:hypothetical protein
MITRSLGKDPITGLETIHHYDESTDYTHIEYKQDVTAGLNMLKALQNTDFQKKGVKEDWMPAAWIPEIVQIQWMHKYGITDIYSEEYMPLIIKLLNSQEYSHLKYGDKRL